MFQFARERMAYYRGVSYSVVLCMTNDVARNWQNLPSKVILVIMTWPIYSRVPFCTNHVVYLLNAHFFGFSRSLVKSLSDWFCFSVSSLLEVIQSVKIFLNVNNVLLRSLFTLVSLFWVPVSTRSLVSFHSNAESSFLMITNIHNS